MFWTERQQMFEGKAKPVLRRDWAAVIPLSACSACAGDYEDPDRTAWDGREDEKREDALEKDDEFSASRNEWEARRGGDGDDEDAKEK
jgi:hypothetical protein